MGVPISKWECPYRFPKFILAMRQSDLGSEGSSRSLKVLSAEDVEDEASSEPSIYMKTLKWTLVAFLGLAALYLFCRLVLEACVSSFLCSAVYDSWLCVANCSYIPSAECTNAGQHGFDIGRIINWAFAITSFLSVLGASSILFEVARSSSYQTHYFKLVACVAASDLVLATSFLVPVVLDLKFRSTSHKKPPFCETVALVGHFAGVSTTSWNLAIMVNLLLLIFSPRKYFAWVETNWLFKIFFSCVTLLAVSSTAGAFLTDSIFVLGSLCGVSRGWRFDYLGMFALHSLAVCAYVRLVCARLHRCALLCHVCCVTFAVSHVLCHVCCVTCAEPTCTHIPHS